MTRIFSGGQKYIPSGCHHRAPIYRLCTADFPWHSARIKEAARPVPDGIFPALCDQYAGGWHGIYGAVPENRIYGRFNQPDAALVRCRTGGFYQHPYWAKMFVLCFYTIWVVMPFKILILTSALASVNPDYYKAAKVDRQPRRREFSGRSQCR